MTRTTNADIGERIAAMEATLDEMRKHIATREQVGRVETRLTHIESRMPELTVNTHRADKGDGWREAKDDSHDDGRSLWAVIISTLALASTLVINWWSNGQ